MTNFIIKKYRMYSEPWKKAIAGIIIWYPLACLYIGRVKIDGFTGDWLTFLLGWFLLVSLLFILKNTIQGAMYRAMYPDDENEAG